MSHYIRTKLNTFAYLSKFAQVNTRYGNHTLKYDMLINILGYMARKEPVACLYLNC